MVTYLNNLPSFDKDNFSNFQPDLNQYATKKQHSYVIGGSLRSTDMMDEQTSRSSFTNTDEDSCSCDTVNPHFTNDSGGGFHRDEQLIVNPRCNIIIQYLDKNYCDEYNDDRDDADDNDNCHSFSQQSRNHHHMMHAEKSRKRDIREVLDTNPESIGGGRKTSRISGENDHGSVVNSQPMASKYIKKRRTSVQNSESIVVVEQQHPSANVQPVVSAVTAEVEVELIEIDNTTTTTTTTRTSDNVDF